MATSLESEIAPHLAFETRALHAGAAPDPVTGAILTPIYQSTTYVQEAVGVHKGYTYSRTANPTVAALEGRLAALEGAEHAACFATGLAATAALAIALFLSAAISSSGFAKSPVPHVETSQHFRDAH